MNENALTHLLFTTLGKVEPRVRARFLSDVVGLAGKLDGPAKVRTQARWEDAGQKRAIVVGIAPLPGLDHGADRHGGSIVDAVVFTGGIAALFEMKVTGVLRRAQLVRHARHWALDLDDTGISDAELELDDGFALRTWDHVRGWLGRQLADEQNSQPDRRRLAELATAIERCGLGTPDQAQDVATLAVTLPVDHPRPVPVREMVAGIDLDVLARKCVGMYGKHGTHRVDKHACRQDAQRIAAEYEQAQQPPPRDIAGDPMTPPRVLTVLYSNEGLTDAAPKSWTDLRTRLLNRGADRTVLLALLAWARQNEGSTSSKRLYEAVARIWSQTEERLPALGELHAAVDAARQAPRAA